jgi:ADP-ribosylglycohydrolase
MRRTLALFLTAVVAGGLGGAIAGAIAGARLGPTALPAVLVDQLNDRGEWRAPQLAELADRVAGQ